MVQIFISYSSSDSEVAARLRELLTRLGHTVWQDATSLKPGDDWRESTLSAIRNSDLILAVPSQQTNSNVLFETGFAFGLDKKVVLMVPHNANIPSDLSNVNSVRIDDSDAVIGQNLDAAIGRITENITQRAPDGTSTTFKDPVRWAHLDFRDFERRVAEWFTENVGDVKLSRDRYDLVVTDKAGHRFIVEAKRFSTNNLVPISVVMQVYAEALRERADGAIVITTSDYTPSAKDFAARADIPVHLWKTSEINNWTVPQISSRNG